MTTNEAHEEWVAEFERAGEVSVCQSRAKVGLSLIASGAIFLAAGLFLLATPGFGLAPGSLTGVAGGFGVVFAVATLVGGIRARIDVLVIDDFLLRPLTPDQAADTLEVIEDRAGLRSTIHHEPAADGHVARGHGGADGRRRSPRPGAAQPAPHRARGRVDAPPGGRSEDDRRRPERGKAGQQVRAGRRRREVGR